MNFAPGAYTEWRVDVPVPDLLDAAIVKRDYHQARLEHWSTERESAEEKLRAEGVEFRSAPARYTNTVSSGAAALDVVIDPNLKRALDETRQKVEDHTGFVTRYTRWVSFFNRADQRSTYPCDFETFEEMGL